MPGQIASRNKLLASIFAVGATVLPFTGFADICLNGFRALAPDFYRLPIALEHRELELRALGSKELEAMRNGTVFHYIVDHDNHIWVSSLHGGEVPPVDSRSLLVVTDSRGSLNQGGPILPKQSGTLLYDSQAKTYRLVPETSMDLSGEEILSLNENLRHALADSRVERLAPPDAMKASRFIECAEILKGQAKGKTFLRDMFISNNLVFATALVTVETGGANRLSTEHGREVVRADWIGSNLTTLLGGSTALKFTQMGMHPAKDWAARTGVKAANIGIYDGLYRTTLSEDANKTANSLTGFQVAWMAGKVPLSYVTDKYILEKIPLIFFEACTRNAKAKIFVSPTAVRLYESYLTAVIYMGLRKAVVGN